MANVIGIDSFAISASFSGKNVALRVKEDDGINLVGKFSVQLNGLIGRSVIRDIDSLI